MPAVSAAAKGMITREIAQQAANWAAEQQAGAWSAPQQAQFERWLAAHTAHAQAWQQLQILQGRFAQADGAVGRAALAEAPHSRRRFLKKTAMGIASIAIPAAGYQLIPWQVWSANLQTACGETRSLHLADGTQLQLSSQTALDLIEREGRSQIRLYRGEIWLDTASRQAHAAPRTLEIITAHARLQPLGTRFSVQQGEQSSRLAVFQHRVAVQHRHGEQQIVAAGEQVRWTEQGIAPRSAVDELQASAWRQGLYIVEQQKLATVLATLAQWRAGIIQVDPAIADLSISGAFPLKDTNAALALIARTLPVKIRRWSEYWVRVQAA
jgi:transmembrane sensor